MEQLQVQDRLHMDTAQAKPVLGAPRKAPSIRYFSIGTATNGRTRPRRAGESSERSDDQVTANSPSRSHSSFWFCQLRISGVSCTYFGSSTWARLKWSDVTCVTAASSSNASRSTYWFGSSRLRDHSKKRLPASARVDSVNSRPISGHRSAKS